MGMQRSIVRPAGEQAFERRCRGRIVAERVLGAAEIEQGEIERGIQRQRLLEVLGSGGEIVFALDQRDAELVVGVGIVRISVQRPAQIRCRVARLAGLQGDASQRVQRIDIFRFGFEDGGECASRAAQIAAPKKIEGRSQSYLYGRI